MAWKYNPHTDELDFWQQVEFSASDLDNTRVGVPFINTTDLKLKVWRSNGNRYEVLMTEIVPTLSYFLQEDGSSRFLLEDGTSLLALE